VGDLPLPFHCFKNKKQLNVRRWWQRSFQEAVSHLPPPHIWLFFIFEAFFLFLSSGWLLLSLLVFASSRMTPRLIVVVFVFQRLIVAFMFSGGCCCFCVSASIFVWLIRLIVSFCFSLCAFFVFLTTYTRHCFWSSRRLIVAFWYVFFIAGFCFQMLIVFFVFPMLIFFESFLFFPVVLFPCGFVFFALSFSF